MSDTNSNNSGGIGLAGATFIVFLVLKLTHNIDWSWWWVTAPLWGPAVLVIGILVLAGLVIGIGKGLNKALDRAEDKREAKARRARFK